MFDSQIWFPIFFQSVDANLSARGHIGMKYFCNKIGFWRSLWKVFAQGQFHFKRATLIGSTSWTINNGVDISHIGIVQLDFDTFQRTFDKSLNFPQYVTNCLRREILNIRYLKYKFRKILKNAS